MSTLRRRPTPLQPDGAWDYALLLLSRQDYSAAELERRLLRRALPAHEAARVIGRLEELGLLDDARYAAAYVRSRRGSQGPLRVRQELLRRGVAEERIEAALAAEGSDDPVDTAAALLQRHAWRFDALESDDPGAARSARRRALAFLARRGFEPDVVHAALERCWPESD